MGKPKGRNPLFENIPPAPRDKRFDVGSRVRFASREEPHRIAACLGYDEDGGEQYEIEMWDGQAWEPRGRAYDCEIQPDNRNDVAGSVDL